MSKEAISKGMLLMVFFLLFSLVSNIFVYRMDRVSFSPYQYVNIENLANNPLKYEGMNISSTGDIVSVQFNQSANHHVIEIEYGITLLYQGVENLETGMHVSFRGKCLVTAKIILEIQEIHVWNVIPYLLTIPGVIAFISLFFFIYKIDWKTLTFISRRKENA
ncbi:MAG: hypothetical protein ACXAEU_15695 [Candidatus Hodarchaeales archaeon]